MNGTRTYLVATLGVAFFSTQLIHAGDDMKSIQSTPYTPDSKSVYDYHVHADVRQDNGIGLGLGVYGGAVGFQEGTLKISSPAFGGTELKGNSQNRIGETAGLRVTNVWPSISSIVGGGEPQAPGLILPAMALDIFWMGYNYKANGTSSGFAGNSLSADINTVSAEYVPELKFNLGMIRPYIGAGVGATYINAGNAKINGPGGFNLSGSSDDIDFSAEGLVGVEFFFDPRWAVSLEYKYLYILDPSLHGSIGGNDVNYKLDGLGIHSVSAGLNYYF